MIPFISLWFPVVAWATFIFYLSSIPHLRTNLGIWDIILRKIAHIVEYAVLTRLLLRALRGSSPGLERSLVFLAWALAVAYAGTDEFHQTFIPGRVGCVTDVCIDAIGVTAACLFYALGKGLWYEPMKEG